MSKNTFIKLTILTVTFLSGISSLIFETVWFRYLNLIFGVSVYALAALLTGFMAGLALGSWMLGKISDKINNSVKVYVLLEAGIGIYGLISPFIFQGIAFINSFIFKYDIQDLYIKNTVRFTLSLVALIIPTFLMGGTFPVIIKVINKPISSIGNDIGLVYSINTLGAALGTFLTGFYFIRIIGVSNTVYLASSINILISIIMFLYSRKNASEVNTNYTLKKEAKYDNKDIFITKKLSYICLVAFALSGFSGLSYEVLWTRTLKLFYKDSIYDLSTVLAAFLIGIAIGSIICSKTLVKLRNPFAVFAFIESLLGLTSLASLYLIGRMPYILSFIQSMPRLYDMFNENYWNYSILIKFGYSFLIMLLPTCILGATFPLVGVIIKYDKDRLGYGLGLMNGVNTVGAILGSLLTGFFLVNLLGTPKSIIMIAILNIAVGIILLAFSKFKSAKYKYCSIAVIIVLTLTMLFTTPTWDKIRMSTNFLEPNQDVESLLSLLYYNEDAYGITSVAEFKPWNLKFLTTNRLYSQNTSAMTGLEDHRRLGHIPLLLHNSPDNVLVIGLGAGISLRGVMEQEPKSVDCVEISASVKEADGLFAEENSNITANPDINFIIDDGRNYLSTTGKKYDVIITDILFPMSSGSSNMFSKEYFELCKSRINPQGLMCQWLPAHQLSLEEIRIIVKTFKSVFPYTELCYGMIGESVPVIGCIGTQEKLEIDFKQLQSKFNNSKTINILKEINLDDPYIFLSNFIAEGSSLDAFTENARINTDNHPVVEFISPTLVETPMQMGLDNLLAVSDITNNPPSIILNDSLSDTESALLKQKLEVCKQEIKNIILGSGRD